MEKKRIIELKIDDLDMISGVDQISLVDEPAIEYDWLAFKKESHEFHVPDGEDEKFLEFLKDKGETEEDLQKEGWVLTRTEMVGSDQFSDPNAPSMYDTEDVRVRFRYGLAPRVSGPATIPTTRQWCRSLVSSNNVYRFEDLLQLSASPENPGGDAILYRGGYQCRHYWYKLEYKPEGRIINKASIAKNRTDESPAYGSNDILTQGETYTRNSSPTIVNELSFNKFTLPLFENEQDAIDYSKLIGCEDGAHPHDVNGVTLWMPCAAHPEDMGYENNLPSYVDQVPKCKKGEECLMVDEPCSCLEKKKEGFSIEEEKREIVGPAMIPNKMILRRDETGTYDVFFSEETIKQIAEKFMRKGYTVDGHHDVNHRGPGEKDVYVTESWIIEDPNNDKANMYGFDDLPKGTWMTKMKVLNDNVWSQIKQGKLKGFSVSGFFEEYAVEPREEEFLRELSRILSK